MKQKWTLTIILLILLLLVVLQAAKLHSLKTQVGDNEVTGDIVIELEEDGPQEIVIDLDDLEEVEVGEDE